MVAATTRTSTWIVFSAPTGSTSPRLQDAQDLGLGPGRHVADFVEEDRAAVRGHELPGLLAHRAGEAPLLVAEQLRFDQLLRNRRAVDLNEGLGTARRPRVERARDQLLARPALARDQDRRRGRCGQLDRLAQLAQGGRGTHQLAALGGRGLRLTALLAQPPGLDRVADREQHLLALERLLEEVEGAALGRLDRGRHVGVTGEHHDRHVVAPLAHQLQRFQAVHLGHPDVEQDGVGRTVADDAQRLDPGRRLLRAVALELEDHAQALADRGLVVDDQDGCALRRGHGRGILANEIGPAPRAEPARRDSAGGPLRAPGRWRRSPLPRSGSNAG